MPANQFAFAQRQQLDALQRQHLDAFSTVNQHGSEPVDDAFEVPDPRGVAELRSRSLRAFREDRDPPYTAGSRSQSVAAPITAMAQRLREFDLAFQDPAPPRRATR